MRQRANVKIANLTSQTHHPTVRYGLTGARPNLESRNVPGGSYFKIYPHHRPRTSSLLMRKTSGRCCLISHPRLPNLVKLGDCSDVGEGDFGTQDVGFIKATPLQHGVD